MAKKKPILCLNAIDALGGGGTWDENHVTYALPHPVRIRLVECDNDTQRGAVFTIRYVTGTSMIGRRVGGGAMFEIQLKKTKFIVEKG